MNDVPERVGHALSRREPLLTFAVVAVAAAVRLPGLFGWWPNPDEGIYYGVVTADPFSVAWGEALATSHPPLYFLLLRAVGWLSTDFTALRTVAFVSGVAAVYVFVLLGRQLAGPGARGSLTGLAAGMILALSPRAIVLSQVIRPYMLLILLLGASLLFLLRYLRTPSSGILIAHASCSVLAALLHYGSVLGLAVLGVLVLADGLRSGTDRPEWRRLLAVQAIPALVLGGLYLGHLRHIASSPMGDHALEGWLAPYMIRVPLDAWLGFVGFHSMLAGDAWAAATTLVTLAATGYMIRVGRAYPGVLLAGTAVALAVLGAALGLYPFGPTRHSAWLLVFVIPVLAAAAGSILSGGPRTLVRAVPALLVLLVGGRLLAPVLDPEARPREISEHLLREAAVDAMSEVLDPTRAPSVILMTTETYQQLTPLYGEARHAAESAEDGGLWRFRWGDRDVIVIPDRDFTARSEEIGRPNHLYTVAARARDELGVVLPPAGEPVLVLSGGWRSQGVLDLVDLARRTGPLGTTESVQGLIALFLDLQAYGVALSAPPL